MAEILDRREKVLRTRARTIPARDINSKKLNDIIMAMSAALAREDDGVALAAPQIGESLRLFIVSHKLFPKKDGAEPKDLVFINPTLVKVSRKKEMMEEGCLSVRPLYGKVRRAHKATVRALNEKGERVERGGSGLLAQIFQHEMDHLDGILFTDRAEETWEIDLSELKKHRRNG